MVKDCWARRRATGHFWCGINPFGTGLTLEDLAAVVEPGLDGILIPKVNGMQDVERFRITSMSSRSPRGLRRGM